MLRVHFTGQDLARLRVAAQPDPLWEIVFSLFRFRLGRPPLAFADWRREAVAASSPEALRLLLPLVPGGYFPDFLTPQESSQGVETGLDAVLSTPRTRLRAELDHLGGQLGTLPGPLRSVRDGDAAALELLVGALRTHYERAIAPHWHTVQAHVDADRAKRAKILLDGGAEALLNSYRPMMRWEYPVLECDFSVDQDLHLDGRGLLLVPAFFSWRTPDSLRDPELPPVIVYPVQHDVLGGPTGRDPAASLVALVGATRARVLGVIEDGCTTGELARRVGVTAGSISQHTGILREAGLIRTTRTGLSVVHTLTPLGSSLLQAS
jgi:DNA-binding transcriptional ArsR family regulator